MLKALLLSLSGLCLIGCQVGFERETLPEINPMQPQIPSSREQHILRQPDTLIFQDGVCSPFCDDIIKIADVADAEKREDMLKEKALGLNMSAHEQIHLADIALSLLSASDAADVMLRLAQNPTLAKESWLHLKGLADKLSPGDKKELLKILEKNPVQENK